MVVMRGTRFTSLAGGDGIDQLIVNVDEPVVDLVDLLDNRIVGFEQIIIDSPNVDELIVDANRLGQIVGEDVSLQLRLGTDQVLSILGPVTSEDPMFVENEFAQVIGTEDAMIQVVSDNHWQNLIDPLDVDRSGLLSPFDALLVINALSAGITELLPLTTLEQFEGAFYDVSGEGEVSPFDALLVLNRLSEEAQMTLGMTPQGESAIGQSPIVARWHSMHDELQNEELRQDDATQWLHNEFENSTILAHDAAIREITAQEPNVDFDGLIESESDSEETERSPAGERHLSVGGVLALQSDLR